MENTQGTYYGRMFPEHSAATMVRISGKSSKKSQRSKFQCLQVENGQPPEWLELSSVTLLGELSMPSIGESPSEENVSTLSQILEIDAPQKYYLSPRACQGILRRAEKRGKELPQLLKAALYAQARGRFLFTDISGFQCAGFISRASSEAHGIGYAEEQSATLRSGLIPDVLQLRILDMTHANDVIRDSGEISPTLQSRMGTGGNQIPLVFGSAYCIQGNIIDRSDTAGANGKGVIEGKSYTLNTVDKPAVCYAVGNGQTDQTKFHNTAGALNCMHDQQAVIYAIDRAAFNQGENAKYDFQIDERGVNTTIVSRGPSAVLDCRLMAWIIRRLTPTECERLQGFPDDWTKYNSIGNEIKDTSRYRALGNSIAIPCAERVFAGIMAICRR